MKARGNGKAHQANVLETSVQKPAACQPNASVTAVPKHNTRANPGKPERDPKPILHFEVKPAVWPVDRSGQNPHAKSKKEVAQLKSNNASLLHQKKILKKENIQNMAEIYKLNKQLLAMD